MKRRVYITGVLLIIFLLLEFCLISVAQTDENYDSYIIVDKTGNGDFTTIQNAIDNAQLGSTIFIKIGSYREIIEIKKKITLIGEDKVNTLINPISKENKYAIRLGAPDIVIKNLCITNRAPGIYTTGVHISASDVVILNCDFFDVPIGIAMWTSNNVINNCNFWNCKDEGIALLGSSYSNCNNNNISNCIFFDNCDGIELQHSSKNIISDCKFYNNTHTGIDAIASSNNENLITNCEIYNNRVNGIYLSSSSDNQIINCTLSNNRDGDIIDVGSSKNNQIINLKSNEETKKVDEKEDIVELNKPIYESNKETLKTDNMINIISKTIINLQIDSLIFLLINI